MTDRELLDALSAIARRAGLINEVERLTVEQVPVPEDVPCLAFGMYGQTRLCCTEGAGHKGVHSWERAMVGKSACIARTAEESANLLCQRPTHHAGEHKATGADGVRWTWGDAPDKPLSERAADLIDYADAELRRVRPGGFTEPSPIDTGEPDSGPWRSCADVTVLPGGYHASCRQRRGHTGDHSEGGTSWADSAHDPTNSRT